MVDDDLYEELELSDFEFDHYEDYTHIDDLELDQLVIDANKIERKRTPSMDLLTKERD